MSVKAVYVIVDGEKLQKPLFRRIGTAFVNRDGSLNVMLDAIPVNGKLHIRDQAQKQQNATTQESLPLEA